MTKKKKKKGEERRGRKPLNLNLKQYQKAIRKAGSPKVVKKLEEIYTNTEERQASNKARRLAGRYSQGFLKTVLAPQKKVYAQGEKTQAVVRKLANLVSPKGSIVKAVTTAGGVHRGRGRPPKTYKTRYVPGYGFVKVPTAVYRKMLSAAKAKERLANAYKKAQLQSQADQLAMQQDMRYQQTAEDQFLAEPDQLHEMNVARAQQEAQMQPEMEYQPQQMAAPKQSVGQKILGGLSNFGRNVSKLGAPRRQQPMFDQYGRPAESQFNLPQNEPVVREPRITLFGGKSSILNTPNIFNNPGQSSILWNKRRY